ncbi:MAG: glycosyltransferase family 2 protein [Bacteroidales bacterium]|nr:glycosyltransferase family 2 protein [Bacteroidales bacterium]
MPEKLTIIIPTYNRKNSLGQLLKQLINETILPIELQIIVVVDGSTDGTIEMLDTFYPQVHKILGNGTWWYTKSMNKGFSYAIKNFNNQLVLCLNDDVSLGQNYLKNLLEGYSGLGKMAILGSLSLKNNDNGLVAFAGVKSFNRLTDKTTHYYPVLGKIDLNKCKPIKESELLPGRGLLVPVEAIEKLGGFDPFFFQYQSDYDFCLRAGKIGYKCFISYNAVLYSDMNLTAGVTSYKKSSFAKVLKAFFQKASRIYIPNRALFYWRHYYKLLFLFYMSKFIFVTLYKNIICRKVVRQHNS